MEYWNWFRKQLDKNGLDKVELVYTLGEMSYRSDMSALPILMSLN